MYFNIKPRNLDAKKMLPPWNNMAIESLQRMRRKLAIHANFSNGKQQTFTQFSIYENLKTEVTKRKKIVIKVKAWEYTLCGNLIKILCA